jgi:hypothetical protein
MVVPGEDVRDGGEALAELGLGKVLTVVSKVVVVGLQGAGVCGRAREALFLLDLQPLQ